MLIDAVLQDKYEEAIRLGIQKFKKDQGRAPRVLDLGCGTGMLSTMALKHGAEHVTGLDVNKDMAAISRQTLSDFEPDSSKWKVVCGQLSTGKRSDAMPKTVLEMGVTSVI